MPGAVTLVRNNSNNNSTRVFIDGTLMTVKDSTVQSRIIRVDKIVKNK